MTESTAIQVQSQRDGALAIIRHFDDMQRIANMAVASQLVLSSDSGSNVEKIAKATMCIMLGASLGLDPAEALRNIVVIKGRTAFAASFMAARVKQSGKYTYRVSKLTDEICVLKFYERDGAKWEHIGDSSFAIADAQKANIYKSGGAWTMYPSDMLFARAVSRGARRYCPELFMGAAYTPEEISGGEMPDDSFIEQVEVKDVAPAQIAEQPQQPEASPAKDDAPNADDFFSK